MLALAGTLLVSSAGMAGASAASNAKPSPLPVLYNLGGGLGSVWNNPEIRPATFYIFADGSAAVTGMRWARWNQSTAVTSKATDYERTGPCCTKSDQHYYAVMVTLSGVRSGGGPRSGPYFTKMVITGPGFRTLTYTYKVFGHGSLVIGSWIGGASAAPSAATGPVVVYEPNVADPPHVTHAVRPSSWYLTAGPATEFRNISWSSWGGSAATGTGTMYVIDFGSHNEGRAALKLYDVMDHDGTSYYSKVRVSGAKTEDGVWNWCFSIGEWQGVCPG